MSAESEESVQSHSVEEVNPSNEQQEEEQNQEAQDESFALHIKTCNDDSTVLTLQVTLADNVQDIRQYVFEMVNTSFITSYDFYYNNVKVNAYVDLAEVPDIQPEAVFEMREALYDERSIRIHVNRLKSVLASPLEMASNPSVFSVLANTDDSPALIQVPVTSQDEEVEEPKPTSEESQAPAESNGEEKKEEKTEEKEKKEEKEEKKEEKKFRIEIDPSKLSFSELETKLSNFYPQGPFIPSIPNENSEKKKGNSKEASMIPAFSIQNLQFLKSMSMSGWNPPPSNRRLRGELIYLEIVTLESKILHVTGTNRGFFVNSSTSSHFNPTPMANTPSIKHSLASLLSLLSPQFKKNMKELNSIEFGKHPFEVYSNPSVEAYPWTVNPQKHKFDTSSPEEFSLSLVDPDVRSSGQFRDWNEEYQVCRELPCETIQERATRERAVFRVLSDFVVAAKRGAVAIINRTVLPINPLDHEKAHMFIYNNIFFSFTSDGRDLYSNYGGDRAAHLSANNDLKGIRAINSADVKGLFTLATTIVDYRGFRICAQSIIPGILQREQTSNVIYGSMDNGKQIVGNEEFHKLVNEAASQLHVLEHQVKCGEETVTLSAPVEVKGIIGTDGRHYLLDLIRLMPRDVNFNGEEKMVTILRKELVDRFCEHLMIAKRNADRASEDPNKEKTAEEEEESRMKEQAFVNSIGLNPNALCNFEIAGTKEEVEAQESLVKSASEFLLKSVIPRLVKEAQHFVSSPSDGSSLVKLMHKSGINVRYLGLIASLSKTAAPILYRIAVKEMVVRSFKGIFREILTKTPDFELAFTVSHLLNLLVSSKPVSVEREKEVKPVVVEKVEKASNKKKGKKEKKKSKAVSSVDSNFGLEDECPAKDLNSENFWKKIVEDVKKKFEFVLDSDRSQYSALLSHYSTLRSVCKKMGIQLIARDYDFNTNYVVTSDDVIELLPVAKHILPEGLGQDMLEFAKTLVYQGRRDLALEVYQEALITLHSVYGPIHPDMAECYTNLAMLYHQNRDYPNAIEYQQNGLVILEKVYGYDHHETLFNYGNLALYYHHSNKPKTALAFMQRALYLSRLFNDEIHPDSAGLVASLAVLLQDYSKHELALTYLFEALKTYEFLLGSENLQLGNLLHAIAISYAHLDNFKEALNYEKKNYNILRKYYGEKDDRVLECDQFLSSFTHRAVQRQMEHKMRNQSPLKLNAQLKEALIGRGIDPQAFVEAATKFPTNKSINELVSYLSDKSASNKSFFERNQKNKKSGRRGANNNASQQQKPNETA